MKKIPTLIVDDEPLARQRINRLLRTQPDVQLLGECADGKSAVRAIQKYQPDLVFLDIQMPDLNGFEVVAALPGIRQPFYIFVTAYDRFALDAFNIHAIDYLLKPYDDERFQQALDHARAQINLQEVAKLNDKLMRIVKEYQHVSSPHVEQLTWQERGRQQVVFLADLIWLEAQGNYVKLYTDKHSWLYRSTLQTLESEVDPSTFLRIHRSLMVNKKRVVKVTYTGNHEYEFHLPGDIKLRSGRSYRPNIQAFLEDI